MTIEMVYNMADGCENPSLNLSVNQRLCSCNDSEVTSSYMLILGLNLPSIFIMFTICVHIWCLFLHSDFMGCTYKNSGDLVTVYECRTSVYTLDWYGNFGTVFESLCTETLTSLNIAQRTICQMLTYLAYL